MSDSVVSSCSTSILSGIGEDDVLCGREKYATQHIGNKRFRNLVQTFRKQYQRTKQRREKGKITKQIIETIRASGGRFLKFDKAEACWTELAEEEIYEKVSHALRSARGPAGIQIKKKEPKRAMRLPEPIFMSNGSPFIKDQALETMFARQQAIFQGMLGNAERDSDDQISIVSLLSDSTELSNAGECHPAMISDDLDPHLFSMIDTSIDVHRSHTNEIDDDLLDTILSFDV